MLSKLQIIVIFLFFLTISCNKNKTINIEESVSKIDTTTKSKSINNLKKSQNKDATFKKKFELYGIIFDVECANNSSLNQVTITPKGLKNDNSPIIIEADGIVTNAQIADLDLDGSPEIYVFVTNVGSGSYGTLIAYAANNKKSLSQIYLPDINEDKKNSIGYAGHDEMQVIENTLSRRFYLYGDDNHKPTSTMRQLQYKLKKGEVGYRLKLDKSFDMDLKK